MKNRYGVLLLNVGTPKNCDYWSVKAYLKQFLMDKRVLGLFYPLRFFLVHWLIAPIRAFFSAKKYQEIWEKKGSPLSVITKAQTKALGYMLEEPYETVFAMRYGEPTISSQIDYLLNKNCDQLLIVPMLPQYSSAASGSALEEVLSWLKTKDHIPAIKTLSPFYGEEFFIEAHARLIKPRLTPDAHLLISFHGLPKSHVERSHSDAVCHNNAPCPVSAAQTFCYRAQCFQTARLIIEKLNVREGQYSICFQSRLGQQKWIQPYFLDELTILRKNHVENIVVVCPSFLSDCLETLHEIGIEARHIWKNLGGKNLTLVPCVNTDEGFLQGLAAKIKSLARNG